ncbi:hypothetical protein H0E87_018872 [Populus deltoides]|uniref:K+ potassium transporter integral membrane domain-containing protein n=1 Tax=Populus deltoides TaxID=3696 RepID=A0A8T2XRQ3_POPDE|nr:hypothetical protein H0E87_018872 [Populus deltoides]
MEGDDDRIEESSVRLVCSSNDGIVDGGGGGVGESRWVDGSEVDSESPPWSLLDENDSGQGYGSMRRRLVKKPKSVDSFDVEAMEIAGVHHHHSKMQPIMNFGTKIAQISLVLSIGAVVVVSIIILLGIFSIQRFGTGKVGFMFSPVLALWFFSLGAIGIYNLVKHDIRVLKALNPAYIYFFFKKNSSAAWSALGGCVLCITGAEAMFADLGHFSVQSIQIAFTCVVFPCLLLAYMGQASYLMKYPDSASRIFYDSVPGIAEVGVMIVSTTLVTLQLLVESLEKFLRREAQDLAIESNLNEYFDNVSERSRDSGAAGGDGTDELRVPLMHDQRLEDAGSSISEETSSAFPSSVMSLDEDPSLEYELSALREAMDSGFTYLLAHGDVRAKKNSFFFKKLVINYFYAFLRKNCRAGAANMSVPHMNILQVGMTYMV